MNKTATAIFCLAALFLFVAVGVGVTPIEVPVKVETSLDAQTAEIIRNISFRHMAKYNSPGLAIGIVQGDKLVYEGYFGFADVATNKPVEEGTLFRIGSISKTVTAIGLMQQWERGKFKLDDDVNKYFPKPLLFPPHPKEKPITFRHLLTHTSGGGEFLAYKQVFMKGFGATVEGDNYKPLGDYLQIGMRTQIDPGQNWAYCNYGFGFLGYALENMAGVPFHEYIKANVFEPLGMKDTNFRHTTAMLEKVAKGYGFKDGRYVEDPHKAVGITPAGNIYTNVRDFAKYASALMNGGGGIIKPETIAMTTKVEYTKDDRQRGQGMPFVIYDPKAWGRPVVGHGGSIPFGFTSHFLFAPNEKIAVIVFSNSWAYKPSETAFAIMKIMLGIKGFPAPSGISTKEARQSVEGEYGSKYEYFKTNARLYMDVIGAYEIKEIDGKLKMMYLWRGKSKAKTLAQEDASDPNFFRIVDDESVVPHYVSFKMDKSGKVVSMIPGGLNEYVRFGPARVVKSHLIAVPGRIASKLLPF